jgi:nucleolar protein 15
LFNIYIKYKGIIMVKKVATETAGATSTPATTSRAKVSSRFNKLRVKAGDLNKKGTIYIGHLPKGFNENELKKFFSQFGQVSKLRVSRSAKTARPRGYAFLEFQDKDVA